MRKIAQIYSETGKIKKKKEYGEHLPKSVVRPIKPLPRREISWLEKYLPWLAQKLAS
jgi:hypothetical protein